MAQELAVSFICKDTMIELVYFRGVGPCTPPGQSLRPSAERRGGHFRRSRKARDRSSGDFRLGKRIEDRIEFICMRFVSEVGTARAW
jgi:hypothetical protein